MEKREPDKKSSAEWQREEKYLNQTLDIVKRNVENYESEIREMTRLRKCCSTITTMM